MNRSTLAKALRRLLLRSEVASAEHVRSMTDLKIIGCYIRCSWCQKEFFQDSAAAVRNSESSAEFLELLDMAIAAHQCEKKYERQRNH